MGARTWAGCTCACRLPVRSHPSSWRPRATSGDLGRPRFRGIAHRSIAFTCRTDAMAGRYVVQLLVEASGAVVAEAELVVEVEP